MDRFKWLRISTMILLWGATGMAGAQQGVAPPPQNLLQLSASATAEATQDLMSLRLGVTRDGLDAQSVQSQLKQALDSAVTEARAAAAPGQMEVRTGQFGLFPRYGRDGRISGWNGSAELILEGRDFQRIVQAAARVQTMTVAGVAFALSREERGKFESQVQAAAVERFRAKAADLAKAFGFAGYTLREVSVGTSDQGFVPRQRLMAADARASSTADPPLPVEPGKTAVTVTVNGSVVLK